MTTTNRSIMASSSDCQEQISSLLQLLTSMVDELSFLPHHFSALTASLQGQLSLLRILKNTNLHLRDPALFILGNIHKVCTQVQQDVRQFLFSKSNSVDSSSFKSQGKTITQLREYIETRTAALAVAAIHVAVLQGYITFTENGRAELNELIQDIQGRAEQQIYDLEFQRRQGTIEISTNVSKVTLALFDTAGPRVESLYRSDLEADAAVLHFLPVMLLHMAGSDTLEQILTEWQTVCDKTLCQIEALGPNEKNSLVRSLIANHLQSSYILRTATLTWVIYQLCCLPRVWMSPKVINGYREMVKTLEEEQLESKNWERPLIDYKVWETCSLICKSARELWNRPQCEQHLASFLFYTWSEYSTRSEADASLLRDDDPIGIVTARDRAYDTLKKRLGCGVASKELRLADSWLLFLQEESTNQVILLTEGDLFSSDRVIRELGV